MAMPATMRSNLILPGGNYGWRPAYPCDDEALNGPDRNYNTLPPLMYWTPTLAPTGLAFYTGNLFPEWQNDLFMCSFKDSTTGLHHFKVERGAYGHHLPHRSQRHDQSSAAPLSNRCVNRAGWRVVLYVRRRR